MNAKAAKTTEKALKYECTRAVLRLLNQCTKKEVKLVGARWIEFTHPTRRDPRRPKWRQQFFLPNRAPQKVTPWFPCSEVMREFYKYFDGLREQAPPVAGDFSPAASAERVGSVFEAEYYPEFAKISELPIIFTATTGDAVVRTQKETFVWCRVESHEMPKCADSFEDLVSAWVEHHASGSTDYFDSWSHAKEP